MNTNTGCERADLSLPAIPPPDADASRAARERLDSLAKVPGSLGRLETLAVRLAGMTGQARPRFPRKAVALFAADHAIARHGLSSTGQEVTALQTRNFLRGGGTINAFARNAGAWLTVVDVGIDGEIALPDADARALGDPGDPIHPSDPSDSGDTGEPGDRAAPVRFLRRKVLAGARDFSAGTADDPVWAMTREEALACLRVGLEVAFSEADRGMSLLAAGEMGIGNTSPSSALAAYFLGLPVERVTGAGSGISAPLLARKTRLLRGALARHFPAATGGGAEGGPDPVEVLARVGGPEIGAMAGFMIGAASRRVPVVVDGFIAGAAACVAVALRPAVRDYLIGSHVSAEPGHRLLLQAIGVEPHFDFGLRLGEGTGAALFFPIIDAAVRVLDELATLADLGLTLPPPARGGQDADAGGGRP